MIHIYNYLSDIRQAYLNVRQQKEIAALDNTVINKCKLDLYPKKFLKDLNVNNTIEINISNYKKCMSTTEYTEHDKCKLTLCPNFARFTNLRILDVSYNRLTKLSDNLPDSIMYLNCSFNNLNILPNKLPTNLIEFNCSWNFNIINLPKTLPESLTKLICDNNKITKLPEILPSTLTYLNCSYNNLTELPKLPDGLIYLDIGNNQLKNFIFSQLPFSLTSFNCCSNDLITLPKLNDNLIKLYCSSNDNIQLPNELPSKLTTLHVCNTKLLTLPDNIPLSITNLMVIHSNIQLFPDNYIKNAEYMYCGDLFNIEYLGYKNITCNYNLLAWYYRYFNRNNIEYLNVFNIKKARQYMLLKNRKINAIIQNNKSISIYELQKLIEVVNQSDRDLITTMYNNSEFKLICAKFYNNIDTELITYYFQKFEEYVDILQLKYDSTIMEEPEPNI